MNEQFTDELISAYLDGELTADEQSQVEQALVESAAFRQMFDELRALRGSLQSLPTHKLPADFSQRVLRRAEREMLQAEPVAQTASTQNSAESKPAATPTAVPAAPATRSGTWRGAVAMFAALAAALLVALFLPEIEIGSVARHEPRGVVPQPTGLSSSLEPKSTAPPRPPAKKPFPSDTHWNMFPANRSQRQATRRAKKESKHSSPLPRLEKGQASLEEGARKEAPSRLAKDDKQSLANQNPAKESEAFDATTRVLTAESTLAKTPAQTSPRPGEPGGLRMELAKSDAAGTDGVSRPDLDAGRLVVVRVDTTREVLESGTFDVLLRNHNIRFEDDVKAENEGREKEGDNEEGQVAQSKRRARKQLLDQAAAGGVDVIYVEATAEQLEATLAALQQQHDRFLGVMSQPVLAADTRSLEVLAQREKTAQKDVRANMLSSTTNMARDREARPSDKPADAYGKKGGGFGGGEARTFGARGVGAPGAGGSPASGVPAPKVAQSNVPAPGGPRPAPASASAPLVGKPRPPSDESNVKEDRKDFAEAGDSRKSELRDGNAAGSDLGGKELAEKLVRLKDQPAGVASRLPSPIFEQYNRFESLRFRAAADDAPATPPAALKLQEEPPIPGIPADLLPRTDPAEKSGAPKGEASRDKSAGQKEVEQKPGEQKPAEQKQEGKGLAEENKSGEVSRRAGSGLEQARPMIAQPERVRVLFIIRAVPQDE